MFLDLEKCTRCVKEMHEGYDGFLNYLEQIDLSYRQLQSRLQEACLEKRDLFSFFAEKALPRYKSYLKSNKVKTFEDFKKTLIKMSPFKSFQRIFCRELEIFSPNTNENPSDTIRRLGDLFNNFERAMNLVGTPEDEMTTILGYQKSRFIDIIPNWLSRDLNIALKSNNCQNFEEIWEFLYGLEEVFLLNADKGEFCEDNSSNKGLEKSEHGFVAYAQENCHQNNRNEWHECRNMNWKNPGYVNWLRKGKCIQKRGFRKTRGEYRQDLGLKRYIGEQEKTRWNKSRMGLQRNVDLNGPRLDPANHYLKKLHVYGNEWNVYECDENVRKMKGNKIFGQNELRGERFCYSDGNNNSSYGYNKIMKQKRYIGR
jgi:hypothetical protein